MRRSGLVALAAVALALAGGAPAQAITFANAGSFEAVTIAGGLTQPTAVTYAPDGRMFIAQKQGYVRVVSAAGQLSSAPVIDIHDHVATNHDRGLLGIAADTSLGPGNTLTLYLLYTRGSPLLTDTDAAVSTLTKVTVQPDDSVVGGAVDPTETAVLGSVTTAPCGAPDNTSDCIGSTGYTHSIGTVRVDPHDGTLWVGVGDGQNDDVAHAEALYAQDPRSLNGKILHVTASGQGLLAHPFCPADPDLSHACTKVWAEGFRNPFRFTLRDDAGGASEPVAGDVGWGHWEELTVLPAGTNAGWPCFEADDQPGPYHDYPLCQAALDPPNTPPGYQYSHYTDECAYPSPPDPCSTEANNVGGAIVGGPQLTTSSGAWASWTNKVFITDYVHQFIQAVPVTGAAPGAATPFAADAGHAVFLDQIPAGAPGAGNLVYVVIGDDNFSDASGSVMEIRPVGADPSPVPAVSADASCGAPNSTVQFTGDASVDPEGDPITYHWDFGDGATSTAPDPLHQFVTEGDYTVQLTVSDATKSASAFVNVGIHPGATTPSISVSAPGPDDAYTPGNDITLSGGSATPGATLRWQALLVHGGSHIHVIGDFDVTASGGDKLLPSDSSHGADSYYRLRFIVSKGGCTVSQEREMHPVTGPYALSAADQLGNPVPAPVTFAHTGEEDNATAPHTYTVAKRAVAEITAAAHFASAGFQYDFDHWSDGGARSHSVRPYLASLTADPGVVAVYTRSGSSPPPPTDTTPPGPAIGTLTLLSQPPGAALTIDGAVAASKQLAAGATATVGAPATLTSGGVVFLFGSWSDGGAAAHAVVGDGADRTLTAGYVRDGGPPALTITRLPRRPASVTGVVSDPGGVRSVKVALRPARRPAKGCAWWLPTRKRLVRTKASCSRPVAFAARLAAGRWTARLGRRLPKGAYALIVVATDRNANAVTRRTTIRSR